MPTVRFFTENINFKLRRKLLLKQWIKQVIISEGYTLQQINYVFCSDSYLLQINQDFLHHDTLTDIITFDTSDNKDHALEGEIYISIDRVEENASLLNTSFEDEIYRVIIHGIFHLCGYSDEGEEKKSIMRRKEDQALALLIKLQNV